MGCGKGILLFINYFSDKIYLLIGYMKMCSYLVVKICSVVMVSVSLSILFHIMKQFKYSVKK